MPSHESPSVIEVTIPIRTVSALNVREHHMARSRRVKKEREATGWAFAMILRPALPLRVTLTRLGPTSGLDDDAVPGAMKGVRDQIAQWLGIDDRSPLVEWKYAQRREKQWSVLAQIEEQPA